jgi:hypothetical protein
MLFQDFSIFDDKNRYDFPGYFLNIIFEGKPLQKRGNHIVVSDGIDCSRLSWLFIVSSPKWKSYCSTGNVPVCPPNEKIIR